MTRLREKVAVAMTELHATRAAVAELRQELAGIQATLATVAEQGAQLQREQQRAIDAIQVVYDEEPEKRRRLHAVRQSEEYELAYATTEPLVSVLIPTYQSYGLLRDRAIPSVLEQTYTNWELVIVGDAAPPETAEVVAGFGDPRIRYENRPLRGPYPEDEYDAWLVTAVPPYNHALRSARGQWISSFADDDFLRPHALEHLVAAVQEHRHEYCYSRLLMHLRDRPDEEVGKYPPRLSPTGINAGGQGSLLHGSIRFFEQEIADAIFRTPSDWSLMRRMLRAGVRIGFLDEITCDYYPSYRGEDAPTGKPFR
jgi:glycosyltransferase involved in cell wall biosynthesis